MLYLNLSAVNFGTGESGFEVEQLGAQRTWSHAVNERRLTLNADSKGGLSPLSNISAIRVGDDAIELFATDPVAIPIQMPAISGLACSNRCSARSTC
jgi:hypothetical protein